MLAGPLMLRRQPRDLFLREAELCAQSLFAGSLDGGSATGTIAAAAANEQINIQSLRCGLRYNSTRRLSVYVARGGA